MDPDNSNVADIYGAAICADPLYAEHGQNAL